MPALDDSQAAPGAHSVGGAPRGAAHGASGRREPKQREPEEDETNAHSSRPGTGPAAARGGHSAGRSRHRAAAWRIKTRAATALEPVEVAAAASSGKTRSVHGRGLGDQFAASTPIPVAAPTVLSLAPTAVRQPPPRSTRRVAATSTVAARESQPNVEVAFARGWSALRTDDFEAAAQAFAQAASERDDTALAEDASFWRGVALDRANRLAEAQEALTRFLVRYPNSDRAGEAAVMLGWLLLHAGDVTAAEARFGSALGNPSERVRRSGRAGLAAAGRRHD